MTDRTDRGWAVRGACRDLPPDTMFPRFAADQHRVARNCQGCPVRAQCLAHALAQPEEFGVWGGLTERQRRALIRRRAAA